MFVRPRPGRPTRRWRGLAALGALVWLGLFASAAPAQAADLVPAPGSPFTVDNCGTANRAIKFSPDGKLLATTCDGAGSGGGTVSLFFVGSDGALTPVGGQSEPSGAPLPNDLAFTPSGTALWVTNRMRTATPNLSMFPVSSTTGLGTGVPSVFAPNSAALGQAVYMAFGLDGTLLAVVSSGTGAANGAVTMFRVGTDGSLTFVADTRTGAGNGTVTSAGAVGGVAFSPDGKLLAVSNPDNNAVDIFSVNPDGTLERVQDSPFSVPQIPQFVDFSPDGTLLAVNRRVSVGGTGNASANVALYSVNPSTGALSASPVSVTTTPGYPGAPHFSPNGKLLALGFTAQSQLDVFSVGADGSLSAIPDSPLTVFGDAQQVAWSPDGRKLCSANLGTTSINCWTVANDFEISKMADQPQVSAGNVLTYTLRVHNPAGIALSGTVTDDLSGVVDHGTFVAGSAHADTGSASFDDATKQLSWKGTLDGGASAEITYSVRVRRSADGILVNSVTGPPGATCAGAEPVQPCVTETPIEPAPPKHSDLALTKMASSDSVIPGGQVSYTLTVTNHGPDPARAVVSDPSPAGLNLYSAVPSQGSCTITAVAGVTCELGRLAVGGEASVLVTGTVPTDAAGKIVNMANVSSGHADPTPGNNTATSTVTVTQPPPSRPTVSPDTNPSPQPFADLIVHKRASAATVRQARRITYTITVNNSGSDSAHDVRLTDTPRLLLRVLSVHPAQGTCQTGPPIRCRLGTLKAHATTTITITALATTPGMQVNSAMVMSSSWDPALYHSLARARTRVTAAHHRATPHKPSPPPRFTG